MHAKYDLAIVVGGLRAVYQYILWAQNWNLQT